MKIDVTLKITPKMAADAQGNEKKVLVGHLGTHFDVMNKEFPLEYTERKAIVFDVTGITERDIDISDIDADKVEGNMFIAFYTGFIEKEGYGTPRYFREHPQLSNELIDFYVNNSVIRSGIRPNHTIGSSTGSSSRSGSRSPCRRSRRCGSRRRGRCCSRSRR